MTPSPTLRAIIRANVDLAELRCEDAKAKRRAAEQRYPDADEWREAYEYMARSLSAMTRAYELEAGIASP